MKLNLSQRFFLGVLMLTPSALREEIVKNITQGSGIPDKLARFVQALLKAIAEGHFNDGATEALKGVHIEMHAALPEDTLNSYMEKLRLEGQGLRLLELYSASSDAIAVSFRRLVGYSGSTCPKRLDGLQISFGLAFHQFAVDEINGDLKKGDGRL